MPKAVSNTHVETVKRGILEAAKDLKISPSEVTKSIILNYVSDWAIKRSGGLTAVKSAYFPIEEKDLPGIVATKAEKSYISKLEKELGKTLLIEDYISKAISKMTIPKIKTFKGSKRKKIDRVVNIVLSDLHIGSDINKQETGNLTFGKTEEARRLAKLTKETLNYKIQYRKNTSLNVFLLGDIIQSSLHDPRDGAPLAEQVARSINLLSQMLSHFVQGYPSVTVHCSSGNHGRNTARHHTRAVNQKWDSIETIIYYSLKEVFSKSKNIKFVIPKTPYTVAEVFGSKMFLTHGDTVLKPGYPSQAIKVGSLETQINKINATLPDDQEYAVFVVGHVHVGSTTHLANGAVMITNGCMVPSDEFATSIGLLENVCGQYLFESVAGFPVGDMRFIKVTEKDDKDKSLDTIIKPWSSF